MAVASDLPLTLPQVEFYDLPDTSTLHIYWRAMAATRIHKRTQYRIKRIFDVVVAAAVLVLASPVILLIAAMIKVSSRGPVLYRQQRLMKDGAEFTLLKFRTMVDGADGMLDKVFYMNEANGPLFKARKDPRITKLGRVFRATFLDELPQLVNVLKGEMSLVGPRPILAQEVAELPGRVVFRFAVPQGVTGPWQTHGHHRLTFEQQLRVERDYIESWSFMRDVAIILRTFPMILRRSGS